jgi:hypothetical protein
MQVEVNLAIKKDYLIAILNLLSFLSVLIPGQNLKIDTSSRILY